MYLGVRAQSHVRRLGDEEEEHEEPNTGHYEGGEHEAECPVLQHLIYWEHPPACPASSE